MRTFKNEGEIQKILNEILDWKNLLSTKDWDFRFLRIRNASPSLFSSDYVTKGELDEVSKSIPAPTKGFTGKIITAPITGGGNTGSMKFVDGTLVEVVDAT